MKKLAFILGILLFCSQITFADVVMAGQDIKNDQSYFTANLQKQPEKESKQKIGNHFSFFVINIQINGKINDSNIPKE